MNSLFAACANGTYLLLGAGAFSINANLDLYGHSVTLRGSGPMQTIITMVSPAQINMGAASSGGSASLTSDSNYAAGSTTIKVSGAAPPSRATVSLSQCDNASSQPCGGSYADNGGIFVCGDTTVCAQQSRSINYSHQYQTILVQSVTNNGNGTYTLSISPGLYAPNWAYSHSPQISWNPSQYSAVGVGLEDLTLVTPSGYSANHLMELNESYASWVKGVRFIGSGASTSLWISGSKNDLVFNNYFFPDPYIDSGYPPALQESLTSDTLILNNLMTGSTIWEGNGGNTGDVFAYNYGRDTFTAYDEDIPFDHAAWSAFDLFESNQTGGFLDDDTWGTHDLNTFFRNYLSCWDPPYQTGNPRGLAIDGFQRFDNAIGNSIGTPGQCTAYQGSGNGSIFRIDTSDALVATTLMRWGNCDTVTGTCRFQDSEVPSGLAAPNVALSNPLPANDALAPSFFLSGVTAHTNGGTGLSWWKVCTSWATFPTSCSASQTQPFPTVGPDVTGGPYVNGYAYDVPAAIAWKNLPIDAAYQKSYTIAGSSWSGGTETLTVSTLPSTTHLMGGFQLSGVASACNPSGGELLMTGSSSTTVSYALASNPGTSCTGTFKFPDIRQFDERAYQADSGGDPNINPPTGLNAVVQ